MCIKHSSIDVQVNNFQRVPFVHHFTKQIERFSTQQYYCHVEFLFKVFDKMVKIDFLKLSTCIKNIAVCKSYRVNSQPVLRKSPFSLFPLNFS